jgi:hypothetical protein
MKILLALAAILALSGCAAVKQASDLVVRDPGSAPWDPPQGRQLFEQIPNWQGEATRVCCGALLGDRAEWRRQGCDTLTPRPPRSLRC